jgi:hypothetical protein
MPAAPGGRAGVPVSPLRWPPCCSSAPCWGSSRRRAASRRIRSRRSTCSVRANPRPPRIFGQSGPTGALSAWPTMAARWYWSTSGRVVPAVTGRDAGAGAAVPPVPGSGVRGFGNLTRHERRAGSAVRAEARAHLPGSLSIHGWRSPSATACVRAPRRSSSTGAARCAGLLWGQGTGTPGRPTVSLRRWWRPRRMVAPAGFEPAFWP